MPTVPRDASQMYGSNITAFAKLLFKDGAVRMDLEDPIIRETLITHEGRVVHPRVCELMGLPAPNLEPAKVAS